MTGPIRKVELVVLNYKGRQHLEHLLPTAVREAEDYGDTASVVVVDNRSPKEDTDWIADKHPAVQVWTAPRNDYLFSYNDYAAVSDAEILILLNNDLKLCKNFIRPLLAHFDNGDVFSVGATSLDWEGREYTCGPSLLTRQHGFYGWDYDLSRQELCHSFFTSGGFMAVDRRKFLELGGFNRLYAPAYVEDVDLCFRAWRRGLRCIFEPASKVLHREGGSWDRAGAPRLNRMLLRNSLLFQWSSLPMEKERLQRWFSAAKITGAGFLKGDTGWLRTLFGTWRDYRKHARCPEQPPLSEQELRALMARMSEPVTGPCELQATTPHAN